MLVTSLIDMYIIRLPGMSPWYRQHWSDWLTHESGRTHCQYDSIESYLAALGVSTAGGSVVPIWTTPGTLVEPAAGQALVTVPHRSTTPPFTVVDIPLSTINLLLVGDSKYGARDVVRTWYARLVESNKGKVVYTHLRLKDFPGQKLGHRLREYVRSIDAGLYPPGSRPCTKALYVIFIEYDGDGKVKADDWTTLCDEMRNHSVNLCLSAKEYNVSWQWTQSSSPGSHQIDLAPMRRAQLCSAMGRLLDMVIAVHDREARARFLDALERGGLKPFGSLDAEQWRIIAARCLWSIRQQYRATGRYSLSWKWLETESIRASLLSMVQREVARARPGGPSKTQAMADFATIVGHIRDQMVPGTIVPPSASIRQEIREFWEAHQWSRWESAVADIGGRAAIVGLMYLLYIIVYFIFSSALQIASPYHPAVIKADAEVKNADDEVKTADAEVKNADDKVKKAEKDGVKAAADELKTKTKKATGAQAKLNELIRAAEYTQDNALYDAIIGLKYEEMLEMLKHIYNTMPAVPWMTEIMSKLGLGTQGKT